MAQVRGTQIGHLLFTLDSTLNSKALLGLSERGAAVSDWMGHWEQALELYRGQPKLARATCKATATCNFVCVCLCVCARERRFASFAGKVGMRLFQF